MDIGNQQRVIIVELDVAEISEPEPVVGAKSIFEEAELVGAWPLPLDIDAEPVS